MCNVRWQINWDKLLQQLAHRSVCNKVRMCYVETWLASCGSWAKKKYHKSADNIVEGGALASPLKEKIFHFYNMTVRQELKGGMRRSWAGLCGFICSMEWYFCKISMRGCVYWQVVFAYKKFQNQKFVCGSYFVMKFNT